MEVSSSTNEKRNPRSIAGIPNTIDQQYEQTLQIQPSTAIKMQIKIDTLTNEYQDVNTSQRNPHSYSQLHTPNNQEVNIASSGRPVKEITSANSSLPQLSIQTANLSRPAPESLIYGESVLLNNHENLAVPETPPLPNTVPSTSQDANRP